jgi:hypothetical protein
LRLKHRPEGGIIIGIIDITTIIVIIDSTLL